MTDALKQSLLEVIADWLDEEDTERWMDMEGLKDDEELHMRMCDVAFSELLKQCQETRQHETLVIQPRDLK